MKKTLNVFQFSQIQTRIKKDLMILTEIHQMIKTVMKIMIRMTIKITIKIKKTLMVPQRMDLMDKTH